MSVGVAMNQFTEAQLAELDAKESRQVLPLDPRLTTIRTMPGGGYMAEYGGLMFLVSESREADGRWWRHASVSRRGKRNSVPTFADLKLLKEMTIGKHRKAIQVFPAEDEYYNLSDKSGIEVLHLWSCEEDVLPDFRTAGAI